MELSEDQRRRIEENRLAALAKLSGKKRMPDGNNAQCTNHTALANDAVQMHNTSADDPTDMKPCNSSRGLKQSDPQPTKKREIKRTSLSGPTTVAIDGGEAADFRGLSGVHFHNSQWHMPLPSYHQLLEERRVKVNNGIPENIVKLLLHKQTSRDEFKIDATTIPATLAASLFPFQREGVIWALSKNGRIILADEMGLGKSIQALAMAAYYRHEWPLLILAPASMVASWHEQVQRWYELPENTVSVVYDGKGSLQGSVNIISYDLAIRMASDQWKRLKPGVIIADESHCLRNAKTKRVKTLSPIMKKAGRLIMLSGTPALSRPYELHTQLSLISSDLFPDPVDYGLRYCAGRKDRFGWNFRGSSNLKELGIVLEETVMLRRSKKQVLSQLPRKMRQQVFVRIPEDGQRELRLMAESTEMIDWQSMNGMEEAQKKGELMALWKKTGQVKFPAMWAYISDLLIDDDPSVPDDGLPHGSAQENTANVKEEYEKKKKALLFAHHQSILDQLEDKMIKANIPYIRIDGRTPPCARQALCNQFQDDPKIRTAILSITAASVGLTLTAANLVVFCELFFNPGILIQAEDRAHRIGQTDSVVVHYLLAKGTIDDQLWPLLVRKLKTLESVKLGQNEFSGMAQIEHDQRQLRIDKFFAS